VLAAFGWSILLAVLNYCVFSSSVVTTSKFVPCEYLRHRKHTNYGE
jgi:hypothetical protein